MIIKFDQSPEDYFRLSRSAYERGELDRALIYAEKAVRGKGTTEYRLSLAEIFLSMERFSEAADTLIEAMLFGKGRREELYDLMSRATGGMGRFYESLYYIAKKAHLEGDDAALDAMDEVMQEMISAEEGKPLSPKENFFIVGKEVKDPSSELARASFALHQGDAERALSLASKVSKDSEYYPDAQQICLKAYLLAEKERLAIEKAEEILSADPKDAFALYVLVDRFKKKEYLPMLKEAEGDPAELFYAVTAAESMGEHEIAGILADKLVLENPYAAEGYFVAAAVALNGGNKARSVDLLKKLFSLHAKYPAAVILKGWDKLKSVEVSFAGQMPQSVIRILRAYIRKGAKDSEAFVHSMLTDGDFRAAVLLLFEENDEEVVGNLVTFFGLEENKQVDAFFRKLLLKTSVSPLVKRAILAELLYRKDKGKILFVQSAVPVRVSCAKPELFSFYPEPLKEAYVNILSFVVSLTDRRCEREIADLADKALELGDLIRKERAENIGAAFLRLLIEDSLIPSPHPHSQDASLLIMSRIFGVTRISKNKVSALVRALKRI